MLRKIAFAVSVALVPLVGSASAYAQEKVLRAVTFLPLGAGTQGVQIAEFEKRLNEAGKGVIQIDLIGGPEAIPPGELANAIQTGVIDVMFVSVGLYHSLLPITDYYTVTTLTPTQRRENGVADYLNELHGKALNTHILADYLYPVQNVYYLGKNIGADRIERIRNGDFAGLRMRGNASYRPVFDELGIETFPISAGDIYTAMERGTIDGFAWVTIDMLVQGWGDVVKWRMDPQYNHGQTNLQINLDVWNGLNDEQREILGRVAEEWERWSFDDANQRNEAEAKAQAEAGIERFSLTAEAEAKFLPITQEKHWENLKAVLPEAYERLRAAE